MRRTLNVFSAFLVSLVRCGAGGRTAALGPRPEQPLELFEFEGCPFCRKVREALSVLDLDVRIQPCPKGGPRFREQVRERGGRQQFPFLVDPNTGREMYESDAIVRYLFEHYGSGTIPILVRPGPLTSLGAAVAGVFRAGRGVFYQRARAPEQPLELFGFEASPGCRLVRERLSSLELPYLLHNVARGSRGREGLIARSGRMRVPYLVDPNTGTALFEFAEIVRYLENTYAA